MREIKKMNLKKRNLFIDYIPMLLTAILIIVFSIIRKQSFLKTLPTLVTLIVHLLLARATRFSFFLRGTNALIYGISQVVAFLHYSQNPGTDLWKNYHLDLK